MCTGCPNDEYKLEILTDVLEQVATWQRENNKQKIEELGPGRRYKEDHGLPTVIFCNTKERAEKLAKTLQSLQQEKRQFPSDQWFQSCWEQRIQVLHDDTPEQEKKEMLWSLSGRTCESVLTEAENDVNRFGNLLETKCASSIIITTDESLTSDRFDWHRYKVFFVFFIHYDFPLSVESYVLRMGRVGRRFGRGGGYSMAIVESNTSSSRDGQVIGEIQQLYNIQIEEAPARFVDFLC